MRSLILVRVDNFPGSVKYDVKREARDLCNSLGCRAVSIGMNIKKGTVYITFEEDDAYTFFDSVHNSPFRESTLTCSMESVPSWYRDPAEKYSVSDQNWESGEESGFDTSSHYDVVDDWVTSGVVAPIMWSNFPINTCVMYWSPADLYEEDDFKEPVEEYVEEREECLDERVEEHVDESKPPDVISLPSDENVPPQFTSFNLWKGGFPHVESVVLYINGKKCGKKVSFAI
jgi:hypothetical protein